MSNLKGLLIFAAGALAGAFAGARIAKKHYEELAQEEIEEVRAYYKNKEKEETNAIEEPEKIEEKSIEVEEKKEYDTIIKHGNYMTMEEDKENEDDELYSSDDEPYIIDPSEFGNYGHYATQTCTYFADGVLVDDVDEVIEDPETLVGNYHVDIFRDFDATSVYVRNDWMKMDFEIIRDDWFWSDFDDKGYAPPLPEDNKKPHQI